MEDRAEFGVDLAEAAVALATELLAEGEPEEERLQYLEAAQDFLTDAMAALDAGERCVLVIHGLGQRSPDEPVLKQAVPNWVENGPQASAVVAYSPAPRNLGHGGATLILLRRRRSEA